MTPFTTKASNITILANARRALSIMLGTINNEAKATPVAPTRHCKPVPRAKIPATNPVTGGKNKISAISINATKRPTPNFMFDL